MGLSWIQLWIKLENNRLLILEGFNLAFGWHAYLLYEKWKHDKFFKNHLIRKALLQIWQKYKTVYGKKKPMWVIPLEIVKQKIDYGERLKMKYGDLTYWQGDNIKLREEKDIEFPLGWWCYLQIKDLFSKDKTKSGFMKQYMELDEILVGKPDKIISKLYKYCLKLYTQDEAVKVQMV